MARTPVHPGKILAEELGELGVTPTELAGQLKVPANRITSIVNGTRSVSADTALRLGHWFGTSAAFWLNLQQACELRLAEQESGREIRRLTRKRELRAS
jgi:addiction module HigA family antidote